MQVIAEEACVSYRSVAVTKSSASTATHLTATRCRSELVQLLPSNTVEEMESNVERTVQWVQHYRQQHGA